MLRKNKLITLALATVMVASMSMTAMAETYIPSAGTQGDKNFTLDSETSHDKSNDGIADTAAGIALDDAEHSKTIEIQGQSTGGEVKNVIAASINNPTLTFTYTYPNLIWDPVKLKYVSQEGQKEDPAWTQTDELVTITNYSDVKLYGKASIVNETGFDKLTWGVIDPFELGSAAQNYNESDKTGGAATTYQFNIVANGNLPKNTDLKKIATLTVTLTTTAPAGQ